MFPVPKKAVIIKNTWRRVKTDASDNIHKVGERQEFTLGVSFVTPGYKKIGSPDVVQLQLSDLGDVDVGREINGEELESGTPGTTEWGFLWSPGKLKLIKMLLLTVMDWDAALGYFSPLACRRRRARASPPARRWSTQTSAKTAPAGIEPPNCAHPKKQRKTFQKRLHVFVRLGTGGRRSPCEPDFGASGQLWESTVVLPGAEQQVGGGEREQDAEEPVEEARGAQQWNKRRGCWQ